MPTGQDDGGGDAADAAPEDSDDGANGDDKASTYFHWALMHWEGSPN